MTRPRLLGPAVAALALLAACSAVNPMAGPSTTVTLDQARTMAQDDAAGARSALPPQATLELVDDAESVCKADLPGQPEGRLQVARGYRIRGLPPSDAPAVVEALHRWFLSRGYQVARDERPGGTDVFYRRPADDFGASTVTSAQGTVSFVASSPCIWPTGRRPAS